MHFIDVWGFNHPENDEKDIFDFFITSSFDEVPAGKGAGREWEK